MLNVLIFINISFIPPFILGVVAKKHDKNDLFVFFAICKTVFCERKGKIENVFEKFRKGHNAIFDHDGLKKTFYYCKNLFYRKKDRKPGQKSG